NLIAPPKNSKLSKYDGKRPDFIKVKNESLRWRVYFPEKGIYKLDISAHNPQKEAVEVNIQVGSQKQSISLNPDGKVVAEPNQDNYTDEFVDRHVGEIEITQ